MKYCPTGKIVYSSARAAQESLRYIRKPGEEGGRLRPYKCPQCKQWHLGHSYELDNRLFGVY
jgi:hypothetical protein